MDDLFGSDSSDGGNDTDDLIASVRESAPPPAARKKKLGAAAKKPKKRLQKKKDGNRKPAAKRKDIPDADNDSDSSDDEAARPSTPKSKKERMEALLRARQAKAAAAASGGGDRDDEGGSSKPASAGGKAGEADKEGYNSADSYNSAEFERTKEDYDFIDNEGEDEEAIKEYYSEQKFDDEVPENDDFVDDGGEGGAKPKKKRKIRGLEIEYTQTADGEEGEPDNPFLAVLTRMEKRKKAPKAQSELLEEAREFLERMDEAAHEDEKSIKAKTPALKRLAMLNEVLDTLAKRPLMRPLLEQDLLVVCKRWIQPLPNGKLGNVTIRQKLLQSIGSMTGEDGVSANDLKRSGFGKTVMSLYVHKDETPEMKRMHKTLIEQWSRPIFNKSGNMKDLEQVHSERGGGGIVGIARAQQQQAASAHGKGGNKGSSGGHHDLTSVIARGSQTKGPQGSNRVRVPFSRGFQFTVRPQGKTATAETDRARAQNEVKEKRSKMNKRMLEKSRPVSKNQRSANISVEGRPVK